MQNSVHLGFGCVQNNNIEFRGFAKDPEGQSDPQLPIMEQKFQPTMVMGARGLSPKHVEFSYLSYLNGPNVFVTSLDVHNSAWM